MDTTPHRFRFFRAGGFDQVQLDRGADILALDQLDQKLWVALSCPVKGLEFDERTLALIDHDGDGRIRAPDIIAAAKWAGTMLRDPDDLVKGEDTLALSAIAEDHPEARQLLASARQILTDIGSGWEEERISLADVADTAKLYAQMKFNGDGVVPPASAGDPETARAIQDIVDCMGAVEDRSGLPGVSREKVEAFFEAAAAFDVWWSRAEAEASTVLPLGEETADAVKALSEVRAKIDDWFTRTRLAAFDPRAVGPLNRDEAEYAAVASKLLTPTGEEVASFPLARVEADGALPFDQGVNPAWADRMEALRQRVVVPLIGERTSLSLGDWRQIKGRLAPFEAWASANGGAAVEKLGIQRVRELLSDEVRQDIEALIARDEALEPETRGIALVEKLIRYQRDLYRLLCNFVSFTDFYSKQKAVFQAGTLYLDQRSCDLCVRVKDPAAHAVIAASSGTYLAYCECTRKADGKKMFIAAAFTGGDADNLIVGRNGLFYDRKGADWDATIIKVVEHPISIRQAFWLPYKRISKLISDQVERFASARDKDLQEKAASNVEGAALAAQSAGNAQAAEAPPAEKAFDVAKFAGIFAAIGLAIGAIGSTLAAVATGFLNLAWWQMPLALVGVVLFVSGPSMIIAWLKLRKRSLGPILDANGWAVNARASINIPFGASLTSVAEVPALAERSLDDPYAEEGLPWGRVALVATLLLLGAVAWFGGYLGGCVQP